MTCNSHPADALRAPDARPPVWFVWLAIAWLVGFLVCFNSFSLPNSNPRTSRADVWRYAPIQLLNLVDPQDNDADRSTTESGKPRSGWRYLPQRFDVIAVAVLIVVGAP